MMKESNRLLAAIMFTDMVGYTALMQENEDLAKLYRDRHRKVQQEAVNNHSGKILQYYGDGTLIIFNSAIEAVACAVEIQRELQKEPEIPLRIGMHTGDIVYDDEGVYGDGVNIASRIEGLSMAGSVLVSDKLADEIKNHPRFHFKSLGPFDLKNVKRSVEVFALTNDGLKTPEPKEIGGKRKEKGKSIAVLPFVNMSSDPENEYFSDGITEELLNALTKVEGLQVTARTSSFAFKGQKLDVREVGKQLGVKTILEGSVRKSGNKVRITAQLINTVDGYHIWSETYDRQLEDIFEVQDELSLKIVNRMRENLADEKAKEQLVVPSTNNIEAYNLYLKAVFHSNKWSLTSLNTALKLLNQALEIDPDFAKAYAALSSVYIWLGIGGKFETENAFALAKMYGSKANQLDDSLAETQLALANSFFWMDWNWDEAMNYVNRAIELNHNYAEAHQFKALFSMFRGAEEDAMKSIKTALRLDPLSAPANVVLAVIFYLKKQFVPAEKQLEKTLEISPDFLEAVNLMGWILLRKRDYPKAIQLFEKTRKIPGNETESISGLARAYAMSGKREKAMDFMQILLDLEKKSPESIGFSYYIAMVYADLNDSDNMFRCLEKCLENKEANLFFVNSEQAFDRYHSDPRYTRLLEKFGFREK